MADVGDRYVVVSKELFLEWKDAQQMIDDPPHQGQTTPPPGPDLRGDQINDRDARGLKLGGQAQVKVWRISQDRQVRRMLARRNQQLAVLAIDPGYVRHHLDQADNR